MPYLITSLLAILLALWAGSWTWAEFITITPQKYIERWEQHGSIDSQKTFDEAWEKLITASRINPTSADYEIALGRLALIKTSEPDLNLESKSQYQTLATTHLKEALGKRPSSGLAWAYLAKSVANDKTHLDLFIQAMTRSAILEPYEELNQKQVIPLAIEYWSCLPDKLQQRMKSVIQHGVRYQYKYSLSIIDLAVEHNWATHLKPLIQQEWKARRLKKRMGKNPTSVLTPCSIQT